MLRRSLCATALVLSAACTKETPLESPARIVSSVAIAAPPAYEAIDLGTLGGSWTLPAALDDRGRVVGQSERAAGENLGFLWQNGIMQALPASNPAPVNNTAAALNKSVQIAGATPHNPVLLWDNVGAPPVVIDASADVQQVKGINDNGDILVIYSDGPGVWAKLWRAGVGQDLGRLGTRRRTIANAWNKRPQIVGQSFFKSDGAQEYDHPFLWENGVIRDLGLLAEMPCENTPGTGCGQGQATDINDRGVVVGAAADGSGPLRAFRWENGVMQDLGVYPGQPSQAVAINKHGQITGTGPATSSTQFGSSWLWTNGVVQDLGSNFGVFVVASAINDAGDIVGTELSPSFEVRAFVWHSGQMTDLGPGRPIAINNDSDVLVQVGFEPSARAVLFRRVR